MMEEKKKEIFKELKSYGRNLMVLLIVSILTTNKISIANSLFKVTDSRIVWFIDVGVYTAIILGIISLIEYYYYSKKTLIEVLMYFGEDKLKSVKLKDEEIKRIYLEISVSGKRKKIPDSIVVSYPNWLVFQIDKQQKSYIQADDSKNRYVFNMKEMFSEQKHLLESFKIAIDVIANDSEKNSSEIKPEIITKDRNFLITSYKIEGIKIELRGN